MTHLTKTEAQIMKYLWKLEKGYMKDLTDAFPDPKPAYTTIATILTRMIAKGYVGYTQHGNVREYYPKLNKAAYFKDHVNQLIKNFFDDSTAQFASFFASKADLSVEELEELKKLVQHRIEKKKQ